MERRGLVLLYYHLCAAVTCISAAVSFGFSIDAYMKAKPTKDAALTNAKYAMSRSLSLLIVAIGLFIFISNPYLVAVSAIMVGIQLFDGAIGIKVSTFKTIGPICTAIGNAVVLILLLVNQ